MNKFDYKNLSPFKWFVLENFPFIEADFDALTEWQLFCKLGKEINKIIDSQNVVGTEMEKFSQAFIELKNYVDNYFENLDVQDEINNKLDAMVEDGTLEEIIAHYIDTNIKYIYETLTILKQSNLKAGIKVQTLGYNSLNDGGGATYIIKNSEPTGYYETLDNGKYAELIIDDMITIDSFGAKGDGTTNDTQKIKIAILTAKNKKVKLTTCGKTYLINEDLTLNSTYFDLNNGTLKSSLNNKIILTKDNKDDLTTNGSTLINGTLEKIKVYIEKGHNNLSYININEWVGNAIETNNSFEDFISNIRLLNNSNSIDLVGIYNDSSDETFSHIYGVGAYTGIINKGANCTYNDIHLWLYGNNTFTGSSFMKLEGTCCNIVNCCCDSYENCFNMINTYLKLNIDDFLWINNSSIFQNKNFNLFTGQTKGHDIKGQILCRLTQFENRGNKLYINNGYKLTFTFIDGNPQDKIGFYNYAILNSLLSGTNGTFHDASTIELNSGKLIIDAMLYAGSTTTSTFSIDLTSFVDYSHYVSRGLESAIGNGYQTTGVIQYILENGILTVTIPSQSNLTSINGIPLKLVVNYKP